MKDYKILQQQFTVGTYANRSLVLTSGKGVLLYDQNGTEYLDMMTNYGVNILGHNHPEITKKLADQLTKIVTLHNSFSNDVRAEAAMKLVNRCGHNLAQVYFSNSGAEAIEAALKFAVVTTGKKQFIACHDGYHGKTLGALSATGEMKYRAAFEPLMWNFTHIKHGDTKALENAITDETAAFIVEPIQGEGGIHLPPEDYLNKVREICSSHNILLIVDEIQTGNGRTGSFLASHQNTIDYDIVCLGKGLAGGIPVGATVVSKAVGEKITKGVHTSTFGGNPLACAGILATLQELTEERYAHIKEIGEYLQKKLRSITSNSITEVRGKGLMIGVEVTVNRDKVLQLLQKEKVLAIPAGSNVVRLLPSFLIEKEDADRTATALEKVLDTF